MVRALVCEDEPLARRALKEYLRGVDWIELVGMAADGKEALRMINKFEPDLVFLDVRMPGMDGLAVLDSLEDQPAVVFTTAFDEYAVSAFEHGAVDYLIKPFGQERLLQTLDRVRVRLVGEARAQRVADRDSPAAVGPYADRLFARHRGAMIPVAVKEICRVDAVDGGVEVRTEAQTLSLDSTLGEVESRLNPSDFIRVHRGHLVNLSKVKSIRRYDERRLTLSFEDGSTIVASRAGSQALREMME